MSASNPFFSSFFFSLPPEHRDGIRLPGNKTLEAQTGGSEASGSVNCLALSPAGQKVGRLKAFGTNKKTNKRTCSILIRQAGEKYPDAGYVAAEVLFFVGWSTRTMSTKGCWGGGVKRRPRHSGGEGGEKIKREREY